MKHSPSFNVLVMWTCLILIAMMITTACIYPFRDGQVQSVCRAFPSHYGIWQYAPPGRVDSEHRWVDNCNDAELFHKAYAAIWETYSTDSTTWCVVCDELPECPEKFNSCQ